MNEHGQVPREILAPYRDSTNLRKQSFVGKWPNNRTFLSVQDLADEGFYYKGPDDSVQCVYCGGILKNWQLGDDVREEHKNHFPDCAFVRFPFKHPDYRDYADRYDTYKDWPQQVNQKPYQLAKAGLYYKGQGDRLTCFWCGGVLKGWEPHDDPVLEHIHWFPHCQWMRVLKGEHFVEEVKRQQEAGSGAAAGSPQKHIKSAQEAFDIALQCGFNREQITEAMSTLGNSKALNVDTLIKAILDIGDQRKCPKSGDETGHLYVGQGSIIIGNNMQISIERGNNRQIQLGNTRQFVNQAPPSTAHKVESEQQRVTNQQQNDLMSGIQQENESLKTRTECKVCMVEEVSVVFFPCKHLVCCFSCAYILKECPICRAKIERSVRVFW